MKTILAIAALTFAALPALAATTTVEFAPAEGEKVVAVFSDNGTVSFNGGEPVAYTMDEAAKRVCSSIDGADNCATFETWGTEAGHVTPYTTSQGSSGVATVTATTE
ncbi:MAG: hypothetical protein ACO33A_04750 [Hyphomonas sp.]